MIKCTCVNDTGKPRVIPADRWIKMGKEYHIIFARFVLPQKEIAVELQEVSLDESCMPFEYYLGKRFSINKKDIAALIQMINEASEVQASIAEISQQIWQHKD
jgi:hypothetical protein